MGKYRHHGTEPKDQVQNKPHPASGATSSRSSHQVVKHTQAQAQQETLPENLSLSQYADPHVLAKQAGKKAPCTAVYAVFIAQDVNFPLHLQVSTIQGQLLNA